jgi:isopropylmalate/homocitrate/citramalate synthase
MDKKIPQKAKMSEKTDDSSDLLISLEEIRVALAEAEKLRFVKKLSAMEISRLEIASAKLREREREVIATLGIEIAENIKKSALSLEELSKRIKSRTTKLSKLPKSLDKISDVILEIIDLARRVAREL